MLVLCGGVASLPLSAQAQCPELSELLAIGAEPTALTVPQVVTARLSADWTFVGPTATSREVSWTLPGPDGSSIPAARLSLRPQRPGQDVVLKTTVAACVRDLRSELKSRKLTAQPVTCPGCEAVRYQGPDFDATIYSQMKGDYPFVVVVHQVPASSPATAETGASLLAVDIATATRLLADPQATVLDVRTPEEYAAGHLLRARNINFRALDFSQQLSKLDPKVRYVLYCASGNRSGRAAVLMQKLGITNVVNAGSYPDLKAAGVK
ncbi:rhodanese-like domain-containing protein [Hymenobacter antarcticus]|uniref:rhodanese-like domain-containing protein n=1 Tax=Hymenobacter antarcticus TaxID=486270 RepID=UPI0031EBB29D